MCADCPRGRGSTDLTAAPVDMLWYVVRVASGLSPSRPRQQNAGSVGWPPLGPTREQPYGREGSLGSLPIVAQYLLEVMSV
jgi:hypothetical protein